MRLLFWCERFPPVIGGTARQAVEFLPALAERGYDVAIVTACEGDHDSHETWNGMPVYRFPFWQALERRSVSVMAGLRGEIAALKRDFEPAIVHTFFIGSGTLFHWLTRGESPVAELATIQHQWPDGQLGTDTLLSRVLGSVDWVCAPSRVTLEETRQRVPAIAARSSVVYNGLRVPDVQPAPLPVSEPRFLCLQRLVPTKGTELALEAFATVTSRFPAARLVVAGDGPARAGLERRAAELGVRDAVDFLGWVEPDEVYRLLNSSTALVLPSRSEQLPLAVLQAGLMARPVIAAAVGGIPEAVVHGETGCLVAPGRADELADAMSALLENPDRASRLGQAGRERCRQRFSLRRYVDAYDTLYRRLTVGG
ncbi:glycosyltransferase family 4 protein [Verrucomicrobiota bacterium]